MCRFASSLDTIHFGVSQKSTKAIHSTVAVTQHISLALLSFLNKSKYFLKIKTSTVAIHKVFKCFEKHSTVAVTQYISLAHQILLKNKNQYSCDSQSCQMCSKAQHSCSYSTYFTRTFLLMHFLHVF